MKRTLIAISLLVISLVFMACGTKAPFKAQKPLNKAALVYIYVVEGDSMGDGVDHAEYNIRINGKRYLERIESGEHMIFNLKPNPTLMTAVKGQIIEQNIKLNLKAGDVNYLRISDNTASGEFGFEQVSSSQARVEIAKTGLAGSSLDDPSNIITELIGLKEKNNSIVKAKSVAVPAMSEAEIDAIIERKLAKRGVSPSVPQYTTKSKLDKIKEAFEMKKQGIITDNEFKVLKAEILAK